MHESLIFFVFLIKYIFKFTLFIQILRERDSESDEEDDYFILKANSKSQEKGCSVNHCDGKGNIISGRETHYKKEYCPIYNVRL
jgi:hypothetical protein